MKYITVEEHFLTRDFSSYVYSRKDFPKKEVIELDGKKFERDWWSPTNYRQTSADRILKHVDATDIGDGRIKVMDENGIDMQVLSLGFPGVEQFEPKDGVRMARQTNDELYAAINKNPQRFAGFAALAPQEPDAAASELHRAVTELGFKGAMINSNTRGEYLDEKKYWIIFETAEKLGVPIYIHPRVPSQDMIKPFLAYPVMAKAMWGFAADASLHAMRLICSGVFNEYPELKIILGHLGEGIPFWLPRIDSRFLQEKEIDLYPDLAYKNLKKNPSQYFRDHFYITTSGMFWEPALLFVCSVFGADKILLATDYPYESIKGIASFMESLSINDSDKEKICCLNATRLLGL